MNGVRARHPWRCLGAALLLAGSVGVARAAPPRGTPVMLTLAPEVLPYGVGANGFVLAGSFFSGGAFHWMPTSGVTRIGGLGAVAVSLDGRTIVGSHWDRNGKEQAAVWTGGTAWRLLGSVGAQQPCDLNLSSAFDVSGDGKVVVGLAWDGCRHAHAFRWEESTGMVDLGTLEGESTRANAISGDSRVIVGWEEHSTGFRRGAKWVDGREEIIQGPSGMVGEAFAVNRDGSLVAGANCEPSRLVVARAGTAWRWRAGQGVECLTVDVPDWVPSYPYQLLPQAVSDDGRVMGGAISFGLDAEAVVWFDGEAVLLRDYLRGHGVPDAFANWVNTGFITDVSADGRTLVGYGAGPRTFQGYVVFLPELEDR